MSRRTNRAAPTSVPCPVCGARAGKPCTTTQGRPRKTHGARHDLAATQTRARRPRRKSGNTGHRLSSTAAPTLQMQAKRAANQRAKPITVTYADGTQHVVSAEHYARRGKSGSRKPATE